MASLGRSEEDSAIGMILTGERCVGSALRVKDSIATLILLWAIPAETWATSPPEFEGEADEAILPTVEVRAFLLDEDGEATEAFLQQVNAESIAHQTPSFPGQILRQQPYVFGGADNENTSNGGAGTASINLRALGTERTLTLISGRRTSSNSSLGPQPGGFSNLNLIPGAAIQSIEVLLGGVTTTYGSDAIAGAVNFKLYEYFDGALFEAVYGNSTQGGGESRAFHLRAGDSGSNYDLVVAASYLDRDVIWARDRSNSESADFRRFGGRDLRSGTFPGRLLYLEGAEVQDVVLRDGVVSPSSSADYRPFNREEDAFDYNRFAPVVPSLRTFNSYYNLLVDVTDDVLFRAQLLQGHSFQENQLAPAPWFAFGGDPLLDAVNASFYNPLEASEPVLVYFNRSLPLGNLTQDWEQNGLRVDLSLEGTPSMDWRWEAGIAASVVDTETDFGAIMDSRALIDAIADRDFNPFARASASGTFNGESFNNPQALRDAEVSPRNNYLDGFAIGRLSTQGMLLDWGGGELSAALGTEIKYERIDYDPDPFWETGRNLGGAAFGAYDGDRLAPAVFAELRLPIEERVEVVIGGRGEYYYDRGTDPNGAGRASNQYYSGGTRLGISIRPVSFLRFTGSYEAGFRAPTLYQQFGAEGYESLPLDDPQNQTPEGQRVDVWYRGNPDLDPERSNSFQAIVEASSERLGISASVEYYYTQIRDAIASGAQFQVDQNRGVQRDASGAISFVESAWLNVAEVNVQGLGYAFTWDLPLGPESQLGFGAYANQMLMYSVQPSAGADAIDFRGHYVDSRSNSLSPGAAPKWKAAGEINGSFRGLETSLSAIYIGKMEDDASLTENNQAREIEAYWRFDFAVEYHTPERNTWWGGWGATIGVDNIFDEEPPFAAGAIADGYDDSTYAIINRFWYLRLSKAF